MRRSLARVAVIGSLFLAACSGGGPSSASPAASDAAASEAVATASASAPMALVPNPAVAFSFAGAPTAVAGDVVLDPTGAYELADNAVSFDGVTGALVGEGPGPVQATEAFSVSAWVSLADTVDFAYAVSEIGTEAAAFYLGVGESTWDFAMKDADTNDPGHTIRAQADPGLVRLNQWVHLVGVHDQAAGMDRLYVDGQLAGETPFDAPWQPTGPLTIGRSQAHGAPSDFWPGAIASMATYAAALSPEQVASLYAGTRPAGTPPPMATPELHGNALLNGTWDAVLAGTDAQWVRDQFTGAIPPGDQQVTVRLGFDGTTWWQGWLFDGTFFLLNGDTEGDGGTLDFTGDQVVMTGADGTTRVTYRWALDGDALTLTMVEQCDVSASVTTCTSDRAAMDADIILVTEHTYARSGDNATY